MILIQLVGDSELWYFSLSLRRGHCSCIVDTVTSGCIVDTVTSGCIVDTVTSGCIVDTDKWLYCRH